MTSQTVGIGNTGSNPHISVVGHGLGLSRGGVKGRMDAAFAYGHDLAIGRAAVTSAQYNLSNDPNTQLSVSLPDATGEFTINPANNLPLNHPDNAALLAAQKVDGEYCFAGFVVHGEDCFKCDCAPCDDQYPACPVGNSDPYYQELVGRRNSTVTVATRGEYLLVLSIEELAKGDNISIVDNGTAGDCLNLLGSIAAAGNGALDLPTRIEVTKNYGVVETGAFLTEIYLGG